ncbi:hypothetical protein KKH3_14270 [Pectobacterium actinidiae]|nr:hypothetical protein KKH3_14270 [Pectobacterium actinidiae]
MTSEVERLTVGGIEQVIAPELSTTYWLTRYAALTKKLAKRHAVIPFMCS